MKFKFSPRPPENKNQTQNQKPTPSQATQLSAVQVPKPQVFSNGNDLTPSVRIITLGGTTSVTKNMTVYECGDTIIVVDCGIGFPDSEMLGVDVVLPDTTYLIEHREKVKALFITHGHDDHIGAIPYLLQDLKVPIYSTRLVQGLIQVKLREKDLLNGVSLNVVDPEGGPIRIGPFVIDYFRVNHSVPDSASICIKTPAGTILHCADYKFDWTPVLDKPYDVAKLARLSQGGVDLLLSDCLGSTTEGYARSEKSIEATFDDLMDKAVGKQVFITTISSNVSRMSQAISSAVRHNRKVVLSGRSIEQVTEVSRKLGYLNFGEEVFVKKEKCGKFDQGELLYIVAGAYGQPESSISRISKGDHKDTTLEDGAYVIFSADPNPPGVRDDVDALIDRLTLKKAIVIYSEIQEDLHVSGHGIKGDLTLLAALSKARNFMPIGGTIKHMRAYANMIMGLGIKQEHIFELLEGESVVMRGGVITKGETVIVENIFVDGSVVGDVGEKVLEDRNLLATDGIVVAVLTVTKSSGNSDKPKPDATDSSGVHQPGKSPEIVSVDIVTRGFVYVKESRELIQDSTEVIRSAFGQVKKELGNKNLAKGRIENALAKFLFKQTGREPVVLVSIVEV